MKYYDWLLKFINVDLPIGDLAKDIRDDPTFPKKISSLHDLTEYLNKRHASNAAIEVAINSYKAYKSGL